MVLVLFLVMPKLVASHQLFLSKSTRKYSSLLDDNLSWPITCMQSRIDKWCSCDGLHLGLTSLVVHHGNHQQAYHRHAQHWTWSCGQCRYRSLAEVVED